MDKMIYYNYIYNYIECLNMVDAKGVPENINYVNIIEDFKNKIDNDFKDDKDFCNLLLTSFIPDCYRGNGTKEKLFTKLVEVLIYIWAKRMGLEAFIETQKSGKADVYILFDKKAILCDVKAFRLGRSQKAPNVKDFLKLESVSLWIKEYNDLNIETEAVGGLVVYPSLHEWIDGSEVYTECSNKTVPTLMLSYEILAYLLTNKDFYDVKKILDLWNFKKIFPNKIPNKKSNKVLYWDKLFHEIGRIVNVDKDFLENTIKNEHTNIMYEFSEFTKTQLECERENKISKIKNDVSLLNTDEIKRLYTDYKITQETKTINSYIENIKSFRTKKIE